MYSDAALQLFPSLQSSQGPRGIPKREDSRRFALKTGKPRTDNAQRTAPAKLEQIVLQVTIPASENPSPVIKSPPKAVLASGPHRGLLPVTASSEGSKLSSSTENHRNGESSDLDRIRSESTPQSSRNRDTGASPVDSLTTTSDPPTMRSMFPRYDFTRPLSQQQYYPALPLATHIPRQHINKSPYSPALTLPNSKNALVGNAFTPESELPALWSTANGEFDPMKAQVFTLQVHTASTAPSGQMGVTFGPSPSLPFYTLQAPSSTSELTLHRHQPKKPLVIPVITMNLHSAPACPVPDSDFNNANHLITSIYPNFAGLTALAEAPTATRAASMAHAPATPAAQHTSSLVYSKRSQYYSLQNPLLGTLQLHVTGDARGAFDAASCTATLSLYAPDIDTSPTTITASSPSTTSQSARASKTVLASLNLATRTLALDTAAVMATRNPYLLDTAVAALCAVAVAEARRLKAMTHFAAPPARAVVTTSALEQMGFVLPSWLRKGTTVGGWKGKRKEKQSDADAGIEMEEMEAGTLSSAFGARGRESVKEGRERDEGGEKLPKLTRVVLKLLFWTFAAVVWMAALAVEIVAGGVVAASRLIVAKG